MSPPAHVDESVIIILLNGGIGEPPVDNWKRKKKLLFIQRLGHLKPPKRNNKDGRRLDKKYGTVSFE